MKNSMDENGFCKVSGLEPILTPLKKRIERLFISAFPNEDFDIEDQKFPVLINKLFLSDRERVLSIYQVLDRTPEMIATTFNEKIMAALKSIGLTNPALSSYPTWRLDLFNNTQNRWFPWHQENYHESFSDGGVTLWAPLHKVGQDQPSKSIFVKPGSHKFGTLDIGKNKFDIIDKRVENIPDQCVELEYGEGVLFSNYLVHKSGIIEQEGAMRFSIQLRYDDLDDKKYLENGWPQNYVIQDAVDTQKFPDLPNAAPK